MALCQAGSPTGKLGTAGWGCGFQGAAMVMVCRAQAGTVDHRGRRGLMGGDKGMGAVDWWPRWGQRTAAYGYQMKRTEGETQRKVINTDLRAGGVWGNYKVRDVSFRGGREQRGLKVTEKAREPRGCRLPEISKLHLRFELRRSGDGERRG